MNIAKAAVLGAGTMGAGIAAHLGKRRNTDAAARYRADRTDAG